MAVATPNGPSHVAQEPCEALYSKEMSQIDISQYIVHDEVALGLTEPEVGRKPLADISQRVVHDEVAPRTLKQSDGRTPSTVMPVLSALAVLLLLGVGILGTLVVFASGVNMRPASAVNSSTTNDSASTANTTSTDGTSASMPAMANTMNTNADTSSAPAKNLPHQTYNALPPAAPQGNDVYMKLVMKEVAIAIAPNVVYHAWTFNGTVPGPILRVRQGQNVHVTLINQGNMPHSIDFHAAQTPWNVNYQPIAPGATFTFTWRANYPGVFMYHCGTPTVIDHMANGMYGTIIVDPANGWGASAQEYSLTQSEFYVTKGADGTYTVDPTKLMNGMPDYVVFNGYASQYQDAPLKVKAGQRIRLFLMNAGPSEFSAFHVIGAIFSDAYVDGNPANHMVGNQTVMVPPGGGMVVELVIPDAGSYPFVTHSFANASKGALGVIKAEP